MVIGLITEFPLFAFTTLGGLAAGAYVIDAFASNEQRKTKRPWLFPLVCLVLLGVGLLGVLGHLGRPERFLLAMSNPASMIAEEAYWSIAFGVFMLVDFVLLLRRSASPRVVRFLAALAALGLMCIMGWAYFTSYGNPAWATWQTLPLFVVGDLAMGAALWGLLHKDAYHTAITPIVCAALSVAAAVSVAAVGVHFASQGLESTFFVGGAVLVAAGAVGALLTWKGKLPDALGAGATFALVLAGVAVARWAFYAASIL